MEYTITTAELKLREGNRYRMAAALTVFPVLFTLTMAYVAGGQGAFIISVGVVGAILLLLLGYYRRQLRDRHVTLTPDGVTIRSDEVREYHAWTEFNFFMGIVEYVDQFGGPRYRASEVRGARLMKKSHGNVFKLMYKNQPWYLGTRAFTLYAEPENSGQVETFIRQYVPLYDPLHPPVLTISQKLVKYGQFLLIAVYAILILIVLIFS